MIKIFLDIENTVIDSLFDMNFMDENCNSIRLFILGCGDDLLSVNFFTWGWTTREEIEPEVVKRMFDRLCVPEDKRGDVFVKNDSVDLMIKQGFLHEEDREEALVPGAMMNEYGLTKMECFHRMAERFIPGTKAILIDDLVDDFAAERTEDNKVIMMINPNHFKYDGG